MHKHLTGFFGENARLEILESHLLDNDNICQQERKKYLEPELRLTSIYQQFEVQIFARKI